MGDEGIRIIRQLLLADAAVTALVPTDRIQGDILPADVALPAIQLMEVSSVRLGTLKRASTEYFRDRIQVTVQAQTDDSMRAIALACFWACDRQRPVLSGLSLVSVVWDGDGPDGYDPGTMARVKTLDFGVSYNLAS